MNKLIIKNEQKGVKMKKLLDIGQIYERIDATYQIKTEAEVAVKAKIGRLLREINETGGKKHWVTESQAKNLIIHNHNFWVDHGKRPMPRMEDIEWLVSGVEHIDIPFDDSESAHPITELSHSSEIDINEDVPAAIIENREIYPSNSIHIVEEVDLGAISSEEILAEKGYRYGTLTNTEEGLLAIYEKDDTPAQKAYEIVREEMREKALFDRFFVMNEDLLKEDVSRLTLGYDSIDHEYIEAQQRIKDFKSYVKPIPKEIADAISHDTIKEIINDTVNEAVNASAKRIGNAIAKNLYDIVFTSYAEAQSYDLDQLAEYGKKYHKKYSGRTSSIEENEDELDY